ncbi:glyoxylate reductase/hydroxypyruvate reductase isoform X5 [Procambarus clarkii]|uniref:glyoxylate reductase/hydroxypyruvate reductase isoform X5 n=1 Tax=Procambarus clarkii TaxID=6728 RepID=UPI001E67104D|nr:glyoxylate reductase/hydroxypyruvate reductase-like isoform X4 [Procambarus clarkii]
MSGVPARVSLVPAALATLFKAASATSHNQSFLKRLPSLPHTLNRSLYTSSATMSRPKVLVSRSDIPQTTLDFLNEKCEVDIWNEAFPIPRDELLKRISGKDALFCLLTETIDKAVLDAAGPTLKVIGTMSVGHDHLNLEEIKRRGIKVGYTPGVLTDATAELTVALLLATSRRLFEAHAELLNGGWGKCAWSPLWMTGWGLAGSTVGIFGLGRIGQGVLRRLQGFGVKRFIYSGRSPRKEGEEMGAEYVSFDVLLRDSDFITVTCALNDETHEIFDDAAFTKMKSSAIIVNTSRGGVINQDALIKALKTNKIRAAGLDVMVPEPLPPDHELTTLPNCTLIPHIGSAETTTREAMANLTASNIIAGLEGRPMPACLC